MKKLLDSVKRRLPDWLMLKIFGYTVTTIKLDAYSQYGYMIMGKLANKEPYASDYGLYCEAVDRFMRRHNRQYTREGVKRETSN